MRVLHPFAKQTLRRIVLYFILNCRLPRVSDVKTNAPCILLGEKLLLNAYCASSSGIKLSIQTQQMPGRGKNGKEEGILGSTLPCPVVPFPIMMSS
ncbi:hypothetical protein CEXT_429671 [Caerostris extrusa]|uniref:Uncharacterized protein n=1 Tax=Caerostris extrusa TaxID=172846 RepID=A0AAV4Q1D9_CAEEX|nr:hypothetical protein CEXT_429671 [Caerostris extrusa]